MVRLKKISPQYRGVQSLLQSSVLEVGESVVVKYGTGTKKALLHNVAGDVKVIGNFRTIHWLTSRGDSDGKADQRCGRAC